MPLHPHSTLPAPLSIGDALARSDMLVHLQALLRESNARFDSIRPLLPPALAAQLRPGPVAEDGWTLFASSPAVAAKLRQWLPRLTLALQQQGFQGSAIQIRVQPTSHS